MKLQLNNTEYTIEEWEFGQWIWITDKDESAESYPFAYQAMQDAIDREQEKIDAVKAEQAYQLEHAFGTYESQVINHYNKVIRS